MNCFGAAIGTPDINLWATENLGTLCSAVWMGFVADLESYNFIETPIRTVASSFFRISDLDRSTSAPSSSPDSSHAAVVSSSFASVLLLWYAVAWL